LSRFALEVADIFRTSGPVYRAREEGHLTQLEQIGLELLIRFVAAHESNQRVGSRKSLNLAM
jgi:hypothetical protein